MSTLIGFVTGMLAAVALVSYYPQLAQRIGVSADSELSAPQRAAAIVVAGAQELAVVPADLALALEPAATAVMEFNSNKGLTELGREEAETTSQAAAALVATTVAATVAATVDSASQPVDAGAEAKATASVDSVPATPTDLEARWADYARQAEQLEPAGSFPWQVCFQRAAATHQIPQTLLLAVASGESGFDPAAISNRQAIGLMQIRWPQTSRHLGVLRQADLFDPCRNVDAGARYLAELRQRYDGNLHLALAAYNYGPSRIKPGTVPSGANWYSHYIYQHLEKVLGRVPTPSSQLVAAGDSGGQQVLMTFGNAHRARQFVSWLDAAVPGLTLQQRSEQLGLHEVILLYRTDEQRRAALQKIAAIGLTLATAHNSNDLYL